MLAGIRATINTRLENIEQEIRRLAQDMQEYGFVPTKALFDSVNEIGTALSRIKDMIYKDDGHAHGKDIGSYWSRKPGSFKENS